MSYLVCVSLKHNPVVDSGNIRFNVLKDIVVLGLPEIPNEKNR